MDKLTEHELLKLITAYDSYIQRANDECLYKDEWYPVCIEEFYHNEFEEDYYE
nr:MAG TPA: hypothetical protein [Caudoviricetes sp.]